MDYEFGLIICLRDLLACLPNPVYLNLRCTPKQPTCAYRGRILGRWENLEFLSYFFIRQISYT